MDNRQTFDRLLLALGRRMNGCGLASVHDALIHWWAEYALGLDPGDAKDRIVTDAHAEGIDALLLDTSNYQQVFVQAKTVSDFDHVKNNYAENDLKLALAGLRFLLRGDYRGKITPQLENLVDEFHANDRSHAYKTVMSFLALKAPPADWKFIDDFRSEFPEIEVDFWDADRLFQFYINEYLPMRDEPPPMITFKVRPDFLKKDSPRKAWVFACRGEDLARAYHEFGQRLLEHNVRLPLGARKKSINSQIVRTASETDRAADFWYFNNGVTLICSKLHVTSNSQVVTLDQPQIINGAQTTYALHEAFVNSDLKAEVEVLIRAIETNDLVFSENVTLYANSQNAIRLRDLCSNDAMQIEIQRILFDSYGYVYVRRRGELQTRFPTRESCVAALGSDYEAKIVDNELAAQAFLALYLSKPSYSKNEKGRIFMKEGGLYGDIFRDSINALPEKLLLSWSLLRYVLAKKEGYRVDYLKADKLNDAQRRAVYTYDFILHAEYYVTNLLGDFLRAHVLDIDTREGVLAALQWIGSSASALETDYARVVAAILEAVRQERKVQGKSYYHNRFFKSESALASIRRSGASRLLAGSV